MTQINQKTAVVNTIKEVLGSSYDPSSSVTEQLTPDQKKIVIDKITAGIMSGDILYNKEVDDETAVRRYASGMISNHIRKAKELNGYHIYNPTSTGRGTRDSKLSALKKLLQTYTIGTQEHDEIQEAINNRQTELSSKIAKSVASKKTTIDISDLPDDLKDLVNTL